MLNERDFIIDITDDSVLETREALLMCLKHMSLDDVRDIIYDNDLSGLYDDFLKRNKEG